MVSSFCLSPDLRLLRSKSPLPSDHTSFSLCSRVQPSCFVIIVIIATAVVITMVHFDSTKQINCYSFIAAIEVVALRTD
jgi:hypothetical protein